MFDLVEPKFRAMLHIPRKVIFLKFLIIKSLSQSYIYRCVVWRMDGYLRWRNSSETLEVGEGEGQEMKVDGGGGTN